MSSSLQQIILILKETFLFKQTIYSIILSSIHSGKSTSPRQSFAGIILLKQCILTLCLLRKIFLCFE